VPPFLYGLVAVAWIASSRGGYYATAWSWSALAALLLCTFVLVLSRSVGLGRFDGLLLGGLAAFTAWTLASVAWSNSVPSTIDAATRSLAYFALVAAALLLTRPRTSRFLVGGVFTGATLVCLYALATRLLPDRVGTFDSVAGGYRLSTPITYWNGLGVFAVMALLLGFTFGVRARLAAVRAISAASLPLLAATAYFTFSRGAWLALAAGTLVAVAVDRDRLQLTANAALLAAPTAVAVWLSSRPEALRVLGSSVSDATTTGHRLAEWLVVLSLVAAALAVGAHVVGSRLTVPTPLRLAWAAILVLAVLAGVSVLWVEKGSPVHEAHAAWDAFNRPPSSVGTNVGNRLFDLSSNGRISLWHVAWRSSRDAPVLGHGAGTFWQTWAADRTVASEAKDTHDLYLQTLSEVGAVGLALLVLALLAPVAAALRTRGRLTCGLLAVYSAWLVHAAVDWDWQLLGVSAVAVLVGAAAIARVRTEGTRIREPVRWPLAGASALLAAVAFCAVMANVSIARASSSYAHGSLAAADRYARRAARWNRWAAAPWDLRASVAAQQGDARAARADMLAALDRDPHNWQLYLRLALVTRGAERAAAFATAGRLDPLAVPATLPPSLVRKPASTR
jgi:O-Antigen ligase